MKYWNMVNLVFVFTFVLVVLLFCLLGQRMERAFLLVKGGTTTRAPSGDGPKTTSALKTTKTTSGLTTTTTTTTTSAPTTTTTTSAPTYRYYRYTNIIPKNSTLVKNVSTASRVRSPEESKNGVLNHRYYYYSRSHGHNRQINGVSGEDRVMTDDAIENCKAECTRHDDCEGFKVSHFWPEYGCELVNYRSQTASPNPGGDGWKGTSGTDWYAKRPSR